MIEGAVAITLVIEAISNIVSVVIASCLGLTDRFPNALKYAIRPCRATSTTAPGISPA